MGNSLKKKSLFITFMKGVMFIFALGENPIREYNRKYRSGNDASNMAEDWRNVGNDIRTAYERYKSAQKTN